MPWALCDFVPYLGIEPSSSRFSSLAISVSPQTFILTERIYLHFNSILGVVSTSGCLQQSHMAISQCVCITSWTYGTGLYVWQLHLFCGPEGNRTLHDLLAREFRQPWYMQAQNTHLTFNSTFTTNYRMSLRVLVNHFSERYYGNKWWTHMGFEPLSHRARMKCYQVTLYGPYTSS